MKSILLALLVAITLLGLAGCGQGTQGKPEPTGTTGYRLLAGSKYVAGEVTVKFWTDIKPRRELKDRGVSPEQATREQFQVLTTQPSINEINRRFSVYDFTLRPSYGRADLDNTYTFYFSEDNNIEDVVDAYLRDANVEYAHPHFLGEWNAMTEGAR